VHVRPAFEWFAHTFVPGPDCGLVYPVLSSRARARRRNHQVPRVPLPDVGVTFIGETCTPPPGTLLPVPSSYGLIRQSPVALPYFGLPHHSIGSASRLIPRIRFFTGRLSRLQLFLYVQASKFARLPDRSHRCSFLAGQPRLFTSEQNVRCYLRTHRTCYPPDYRQLAERGLSPRKIRSLVGCSRMMPTFPLPPLKLRTAGFPGAASRPDYQTRPSQWTGLPFVFRALCFHRAFPALCQGRCAYEHFRASGLALYPRGPRSGPGYAVPVHHHLIGPIRPTRGHIPISPTRGLYVMPSLCLLA
jgi:hypothetical protein